MLLRNLKSPARCRAFQPERMSSAYELVEGLLDGIARYVAHDLVLHLAIFKNQQRGNSTNTITLGRNRAAVYIHLAHFYFAVISAGHFVHDRGQCFAWTAPCCPEIDHDRLFTLQDHLVK